jgi:casein kinase II subunit beta
MYLGLAILYGRYLRREYGTCPRALCDSQGVLPVGMNDKLRVSRVKVFCPKCEELYVPQTNSARAAALDGSYFGTSLCHVFLKAYENLIVLPPVTYNYEPMIFGFKMAGKAGSKLWEPRTESIVNTKERETVLFEKISGKRNYQTASKESALLKPSFHGQKTVKVNVNKNNNNNTKQQKAVA